MSHSMSAFALCGLFLFGTLACSAPQKEETSERSTEDTLSSKYNHKPLVTDLYTADPAAHVFEGKIYIYPSHDVETDVAQDDLGSHFDMKDYHVYSMETDRKSTRLNSSHVKISYAVFCLKKKTGCGSSPRRPAAPPPPPR